MLTSDFDYNLPQELIAQTPVEPRDASRMMVVDRKTTPTLKGRGSDRRVGEVEHKNFYDIVDYLQKGDLLVWNNTKVFKARLRGQIMLDEEIALATPPAPPLGKRGIVPTDRILNVAPVEIFLVRPMENNKVWKALAKPGRKLRLGMKIVFAPDFSAEVMLKENDGTF